MTEEIKKLPIDKHVIETLIKDGRIHYGADIPIADIQDIAECEDSLVPFLLMAIRKRLRDAHGFQVRQNVTTFHIMDIEESNEYSRRAPARARRVFTRAVQVAGRNALDASATGPQREEAERIAGRAATLASFIKDPPKIVLPKLPERF